MEGMAGMMMVRSGEERKTERQSGVMRIPIAIAESFSTLWEDATAAAAGGAGSCHSIGSEATLSVNVTSSS